MNTIWRKRQTGICLKGEDGGKARKSTFKKKKKNKDDKNDNKNKITVWDRLGWVKGKSPVCHDLDGYK